MMPLGSSHPQRLLRAHSKNTQFAGGAERLDALLLSPFLNAKETLEPTLPAWIKSQTWPNFIHDSPNCNMHLLKALLVYSYGTREVPLK